MSSEVSSFPSYETYSQYQPYGRDYGNPLFNAAMFGMFGYNYASKPGEGQDYSDAEMERVRSREFMDIQGSAFSHNMLFKMAGFNPDDNLLQFAGKAFGSPDGAVARMLSPIVGGNPMAAQQQLFAGLQGANIMGAFGRPEGVSAKETQQMMDTLNKSFYKQQGMDDTVVDQATGKTLQGVTPDMVNDLGNALIKTPTKARELGIGIPLNAEGTEDTAASASFRKQGTERKTAVDELFKASNDLDLNEAKRGTKDFNEELSKSLNEHIKKTLEKAGNITDEQLKQYQNSNGIVKKEIIQSAGDQQLARAAVESEGLDFEKVRNTKGKVVKGVTSQMNEEFANILLNNPEYAKQEGIGLTLKANGKEDTGAAEKFKRQGAERKADVDDMFKSQDALDLNEAKRGTKDFNEDLSKSLNEHIKKTLQKASGMTDEQLKQYQDSNGMLKKDIIQKTGNEQLTRAAVESAGLDYEKVKDAKLNEVADKMHESRLSRNIQRNVINQSRLVSDKAEDRVEELSAIGSKSERSPEQNKQLAEAEARVKEAQRTIKQQLMAGGVKESEIDKQYETKNGIKRLSTEFLNSKQEELAKQSYAEHKAEQFRQYREAGGRFQGINFENTRGFNIEDFTSSFKTAGELNLLGSKDSPTEKFDDFLKNSGGALSAARGVFGNKSGGELTTKISDLLGSKAADLSTRGGAEEVEKYLRDMKATARIAGVSINAMLDTVDAAKSLAKNNPRLQYMSAAATTDMTVKAFQTASAMSGVMTSTDIRRAGGTQGIVASYVSEQQKLQSGDVGQSLLALRQKFAGEPAKAAALERALGKFSKTGINGQNLTSEVVNEIMSQPEMKDESRGSLINYMNNTMLRETGSKNDTFVKKNTEILNKGFDSAFYGDLFNSTAIDKSGFEESYTKAKAANDEERKKDPNVKELTKRDYRAQFSKDYLTNKVQSALKENQEARKKSIEANAKDSSVPIVAEMSQRDATLSIVAKSPFLANAYRQMGTTIDEGIARSMNPEYFKNLDKKRENEARLDAQLDKKFGARNATVITQAISALASGEGFTPEKTNSLLEVFGGTSGYSSVQTAAMTAGFGTAIAAAKGGDITGDFGKTAQGLSQATGERITAEDIKNIAAAGFTGENVDDAKKRLAELRKSNNLGETQKMELAALEKEEKLGILSSKNAYSMAKKSVGNGHDASAITAAIIEGQKDKKILEQFESQKQEILHGGKDEKGQPTVGLDQFLSNTAKELKTPDQQQALTAAVASFKGDDEKMIEAAKEGTGVFKAGGDLEKKLGKDKFDMIKQHVVETGDTINRQKDEATGKMGGDKDKTTEDMTGQLKALIGKFDKSNLTDALVHLAGKV